MRNRFIKSFEGKDGKNHLHHTLLVTANVSIDRISEYYLFLRWSMEKEIIWQEIKKEEIGKDKEELEPEPKKKRTKKRKSKNLDLTAMP